MAENEMCYLYVMYYTKDTEAREIECSKEESKTITKGIPRPQRKKISNVSVRTLNLQRYVLETTKYTCCYRMDVSVLSFTISFQCLINSLSQYFCKFENTVPPVITISQQGSMPQNLMTLYSYIPLKKSFMYANKMRIMFILF